MERAEFNFIKDAFSQIIDDVAGNPDWHDAASAVSADLGALERELEGKVVSPDKSMEEAAEEYIKNGRYLPEAFFVRPAFIAGANWKARQLLQGSPMPEDTVLFNKGVAEGRRLEREDMLKDTEECELYWDGDFLAIDLNMVALGYSEKDKVKVIVLKDESK